MEIKEIFTSVSM